MTIERGSRAYQLAQMLNAGMSPPDHAGTLQFMATLLKPAAVGRGAGYIPRDESI